MRHRWLVKDDQLLGEYLNEVRSLASTSATERKRYIGSLLLETATANTDECPLAMGPLDAIQEANIVLVHLVDDSPLPDPADALVDAVRRHLSSMTSDGE